MSRRRARELALQVLFELDLGRTTPETALFYAFAREREDEEQGDPLTEKEAGFVRSLVIGAWDHREDIDVLIKRYAKDWSVDRMAVVDRNILRLAIYEINYIEEIPDSVSVDEAVDLAKLYSTAESSKFINGILGSLIRATKQGAAGEQEPVPRV